MLFSWPTLTGISRTMASCYVCLMLSLFLRANCECLQGIHVAFRPKSSEVMLLASSNRTPRMLRQNQ